MLTEPYPDYLLPKRLRHLLWIVAGLIFYGQFTVLLLAGVTVDAGMGLENLSAWQTLADYARSAPSKVFISLEHAIAAQVPMSLVVAAVGSLPLFVVSALRQRRFSELLLLLFAFVRIEANLFRRFDFPLFDPNIRSAAASPLEVFLGIVLPLLIYGILFCLGLFLVMTRVATMLWNRHRVAREKRQLADRARSE